MLSICLTIPGPTIVANLRHSGVLASPGIGAKRSKVALRTIPRLFFVANFSHFWGLELQNLGVGSERQTLKSYPNGYNPN